MSGFCPNHGPYEGDSCPYPPPHGSKEIIDAINAGIPLDLDDDQTTELAQSVYDELDVTELESPSIVTSALLWVKEGRRRGRTYPIRHGTVIGRTTANLILDDPKVSSLHAKFTKEGDDLIIWDFGSVNGTYVNEKRIREATILEENDIVKIGDTVFVVKLLEPRKKKIDDIPNKSDAQ